MSDTVVVLTGGVGGAKLVLGLCQMLPSDRVVAIVNTGDDFRHLGLHISPDIDTLLYTLADKASAAQGWGREGETWAFMEALRSIGGEDWFALGDGDLALHVERTRRITHGDTISTVTADFARAWGLTMRILPMSDDVVSTYLLTDGGELAFQQYFVRDRCAPVVREVLFRGAERARPAPGVIEAITSPDTCAILVAPSNPYLSVDPIFAVPGIRDALISAKAPVVAVSPIVGGAAVKGPTAKLMGELGVPVTPAAVSDHYAGLLDAILVDERDSTDGIRIAHATCDTLMNSLADRARVAAAALALARNVRR